MRGQIWLHVESQHRLRVTDLETGPVKAAEGVTYWMPTDVYWVDVDEPSSVGLIPVDQWRDQCTYSATVGRTKTSDGFAMLAASAISEVTPGETLEQLPAPGCTSDDALALT